MTLFTDSSAHPYMSTSSGWTDSRSIRRLHNRHGHPSSKHDAALTHLQRAERVPVGHGDRVVHVIIIRRLDYDGRRTADRARLSEAKSWLEAR